MSELFEGIKEQDYLPVSGSILDVFVFCFVFLSPSCKQSDLFQRGQKVTHGKHNYFNGSHVVRDIQERVVESRCAICVSLCLLVHRCICFIVTHQYSLDTPVLVTDHCETLF